MRGRRALASSVVAVSAAGCASWTLAPSELDRAGQKVYTQVQVMRLIVDAAIRDRPASTSLEVMLDDVATALSEEEERIRGLDADGGRSAVLLDLVDRTQAELPSLRSAVDSQDRDGLRQVRRDLEPVADRLTELGLS